MKDELAKQLLTKVMGWTEENITPELPLVQAMADYKYDEYGQFSPGMRFVESLALWLNQFSEEERQAAYEFVKKRLIFCSAAEMGHLVSIAYPDVIRPIILERASQLCPDISNLKISKLIGTDEFKIIKRQSLFLGLSDGSHTNIFRRSNPELSHEQIWQAYEISSDKAKDMLKDLSKDLAQILKRQPTEDEGRFQMVFLLDDFSGSGLSYLRKTPEDEFKGKIAKFYNQATSGIPELFNQDNLYICIVLYMATEQACSWLKDLAEEFFARKSVLWDIKVIQKLPKRVCLQEPEDTPFLSLVEQDCYYDLDVEDEHTKVGGGNVKRGFANCGLPLVLSHNTPNNSVCLLWADPELYKIRGLFPRVSRHRS
jgi:hypothetical protein